MSDESVRLAWGTDPAAELLATLLGEPVTVEHLCPSCGSSEHGRPRVRLAGERRPDVSIAHAGGVTLVAVTGEGRVGVDLEPANASPPPGHTLADWVRAEAYLKATGEGLRGTAPPCDPAARWGTPAMPGFVAAWCLLS